MMIQTITQQALAPMVETCAATPETVVAPEGSELAARLRSTGWIARSGWLSQAPGRPAIWLVRFERPALAGNAAFAA